MLIDELWDKIYSITQSQSSNRTYGAFMSLPPKYDQELLNLVSKLKQAKETQFASLLDEIRGQILVGESTGLIGANDSQELLHLIDRIENRR